MATNKKYRCKLCNKIVNKKLAKRIKHLQECHPLELERSKLNIEEACSHFYEVAEQKEAVVSVNKTVVYKCKLCDALLNAYDKGKHLESIHQKELDQMHLPVTIACEHLFEIVKAENSTGYGKSAHFRCKLCKEMLDSSFSKQRQHYELRHASLLERNGMSSHLAAKIYRETIILQDKELPHPRNVFSRFQPSTIEIKKIYSSKISFVAKLIDGMRGRRAYGEHDCQCCGTISKEPWQYNIDNYDPIYLCDSCHRRIKCGNFVTRRIIYSGFETGRKKH